MKLKRLLGLILAVCTVLSVAVSCSKTDSDNNKNPDAVTSEPDAMDDMIAELGVEGQEPDARKCIWSDTTVITTSMYTYFFDGYCKTFLDTYSAYAEARGYDKTKKLNQQQYDEDQTWYEYLMKQNYAEVLTLIARVDGAVEMGLSLDLNDKKEIDKTMKVYEKAAEKNNMSVDDYIEGVFNSDVNYYTIVKCIALDILSTKYYDAYVASLQFTEAECEEFFDENKEDLLCFDYAKITVDPEYVEQLENSADDVEFVQNIRKVITEVNFGGEYEKNADVIERLVGDKLCPARHMPSDADFEKWLKDDSRQPYDIYKVKQSTGKITVTMIFKPDDDSYGDIWYKDRTPLKNIKYIPFDSVDEAQKVYDEFVKAPSEEAFDEISAKYNGGVAENITRDGYVYSLSSWIFDENGKVGDHALISAADSSTNIVYRLADGGEAWLYTTKAALTNKAYNERLDEIQEKHETEYDSDIIFAVKE